TMTAAALWRRLLWRRCSMAALLYGGWDDAARCPMRRPGGVTVAGPYLSRMCFWRALPPNGAPPLWGRLGGAGPLAPDAPRSLAAALCRLALCCGWAVGALL